MGDFFDFLGGVVTGGVSGAIADIVAAVNFLLGVIVSVANQILSIIKAVANFLWNVIQAIGKLLDHIWTGFFKKIFTNFFRGILKLHDWLEQRLGPVIKFLKKVRAWYDRFYKQWVRPVLNTIQHIRRVLLILRALHVKWATALDKRLFEIEVKIAGVFLTIRGHLNAAIDLLNVIVDPEKILHHPTIVISIRRSIPAIFRVTTGLPIGYFMPSSLTSAPKEEQATECGSISKLASVLLNTVVPEADPLPGLSLLSPDSPEGYTQEDLQDVKPLDYFAPGGSPFNSCAGSFFELDAEIAELQKSIATGVGEYVAVGEIASLVFKALVP